jgi:putative glutamine amidotransferase
MEAMRKNSERPRIGVPWRSSQEETADNRAKVEKYLRAVERAGGDPVLLSLAHPAGELERMADDLDAFVLTGSPADVNAEMYHAMRHSATNDSDANRERTDFTIIEHALSLSKPLLAICYGIQSLNVFLGGSLVQDIPSEILHALAHAPQEESPGDAKPAELFHAAQFEPGRVRELAGSQHAQVNSSHHQSVLEPGRNLRITGRAADGVVEAVEWAGDSNWAVGVQWHPERLPEDALAQGLFRGLVIAARRVPARK